jgi:hypothetical protein
MSVESKELTQIQVCLLGCGAVLCSKAFEYCDKCGQQKTGLIKLVDAQKLEREEHELQEKVKAFTEYLCNEIKVTLPTMKKNKKLKELSFGTIVDYQVEASAIMENFEAIFQIKCFGGK